METTLAEHFRVGIDIGGTFTDLMFLGDAGTMVPVKVPSTPSDYSDGVIDGLVQGMRSLAIAPGQISEIGHGFTIATNAILEGKGARTALITTAGFRDVLEFRRNRVPRLYDLYYRKPATIVSRDLRFEVRERMNHAGEVLVPLDMSDVDDVIDRIAGSDVQSLAICLLHAYANGSHERSILDRVRQRLPGLIVTASSDLLPVMKEYERTSTTVINSYVRPVVETYLDRLRDRLAGIDVHAPVGVMQSNGGLATPAAARERPVFCIESGPAAGVMGALHVAGTVGGRDVLSFDMGGTTAKASIIEGGEVLMSQECEVGAGINVGHRLLRGAGHVIKVPAIDLAEVGAGGGSIARVDGAGGVTVGPHSAGARPGPACYGHGGVDPTVTDANVLLGYLNPKQLLGGKFAIDAALASSAMGHGIGEPLQLTDVDAAYGIHKLANATMGRALKAVSSERGRDPRRFTMVAFGGNGPVHAVGLAAMLGIREVLVPPFPGVFSALGLVLAETEHHFVRTHFRQFDRLTVDEMNGIVDGLRREAEAFLRAENGGGKAIAYRILFDIKYKGQASELTVTHTGGAFDAASWAAIEQAFDVEHEKTFSFRSQSPKQLVNVRLVATVAEASNGSGTMFPAAARGTPGAARDVYFGPETGWRSTAVIDRGDLVPGGREGPLIVEEYDATTVVPPGWTASLDASFNISIRAI